MLLVLLAVVLLVVVGLRILLESRKNYPPGPFSFPFLGSLQQRKLINTIAHEEFKTLGDQYGDLIFMKLFRDQPLLIVRGYDMINETHNNRAFSGVGRPLTFREHGLHRRLGLIFTDGAPWLQMRRFVVRTLHGQGFGRKQATDNINDELAEVLELLQAAAAEGREVSVRHLFTLASANSLLQLMVGRKMRRDGQLQHLTELVDRNTEAIGPSFMHLEMFPWLRYVAPERSGYRQISDDIHELVDLFLPIVAEEVAALSEIKNDESPRNVIQAFLREQQREEHSNTFSHDNLRVMLKDLFLAGMETTNTVMEWVLLALVSYPDVQARAAAEVDEVIGRDRAPTIDDMPSLPYLGAVLEESLRWMPAIPVTQHATSFGATSLGGYHIPANCRVLFDLYSVTHDKEVWGDSETFRPERFLGPNSTHLKKHMLAFGLGNRHCIGEAHARQSLFLFTAGMLQRLKLRLSPGQADDLHKAKPHIVMKPQDFRFTVELRE